MHVASLHFLISLLGMHRERFIFEKVNLEQSRTANLQSVSFTFALPQEAYIS